MQCIILWTTASAPSAHINFEPLLVSPQTAERVKRINKIHLSANNYIFHIDTLKYLSANLMALVSSRRNRFATSDFGPSFSLRLWFSATYSSLGSRQCGSQYVLPANLPFKHALATGPC